MCINLLYNGEYYEIWPCILWFFKMNIQVGDVLTLKKSHPCGSKEWQVLRIGADFKLRCLGCSHVIMASRSKIEKYVKAVERQNLL